MRLRKIFGLKKKNESGQALVEFVLVLPLFALILMGIMDFGWLFYNYIGVENSARNAARIACVEYSETNYDKQHKIPMATQTFDPNFADTEDYYTDEEVDILKAAMDSFKSASGAKMKSMELSYSYDVENGNDTDYVINKRSNGDVTVTVHARMRVLTPVLGVFSDHMNMDLTSKSTYKVENIPADDDD